MRNAPAKDINDLEEQIGATSTRYTVRKSTKGLHKAPARL